ncbi:MAG: BatD family protein [Cyclobacteriaceae bacterium]|nr:BatD family protein [Cyclobacteriaceae bacterium]
MKYITRTTLFLSLLLSNLGAWSQENIQIVLGPDEIGENQAWTITVTVNNDRLKSYENFPEIEGFRKRGTSTQSQTSIVNGQMSSSQSIIMTYLPTRQGTFTIPAFKMKVNDQILSVSGKKVKVGPAVQNQQSDPFRSFFDRDPMDDFFSRGETEFVDIKEDALFALTTSKDEVYVGEGFTTTLSFLVADNNRAPMQFHDLGKQLADILKNLKPANCWEENFNIENIEGEHIEISGKGYTQYKIYQAAYYPLNALPVVFPSVGLEMIKFKVAKNPSFFGQNRQEDFKTFYSKAKTIKVKELPPHPLKDAVAVGDYRLDEKIASTDLQTGQSVAYEFRVFGEGNISGVEKPTLRKDNIFDFYEPNIRQNISRERNRVAGTKSFNYFMIPKEPGTYALGDYFHWVFFNPNTKKYDTLKSNYVLNVSGESQKNQFIESTDLGSFYDRMDATDNTLRSSPTNDWVKVALNAFIVTLLAASGYLIFRKK